MRKDVINFGPIRKKRAIAEQRRLRKARERAHKMRCAQMKWFVARMLEGPHWHSDAEHGVVFFRWISHPDGIYEFAPAANNNGKLKR